MMQQAAVQRVTQMPQRDESVSQALVRLEALARIMDSAVTLPGTKVAMGFDALLGLIPVIGDAISGAISAYIIWEARRLGASRWLLTRMATNTCIDTVLGSIPVVGDVFDVAYKANRKNVALLRTHIEKKGLGSDPRTIEGSFERL